MNRADRETVRKALEHLAASCEYHGPAVERRIGFNGQPQPCCATGVPALDRRKALAVLDAEEATQKANA